MNKIIYVSAFILGGCIISNGSSNKETKLPEGGKTVEVKSFKAIHADGVFNIYLTQGSKEGIVVKGYYPADLKISNNGDTLMVEDTSSTHNIGHIDVNTDIYITLVDISSIEVASVGKTQCTDTLKLKKLDFSAEGVGSTSLWVNADTIIGSEDGVGSIAFKGASKYAEISDNGVGSLDAENFMVDVLHVNVNGVGSASVYASKEIYMESSGVGGIKYRGSAKVVQSESNGIGSIKHID